MTQTEIIESLLAELPEPDGARRLIAELTEKHPAVFKKLSKDASLLSDVLTLASYSPLLATTILQNSSYIAWLGRRRKETKISDKDELLESLSRFALTNSDLTLPVLLSRFRRRELLRIYLSDVRRLHTISETTEEISNLADAILEYALRQARQELDNRYGQPLEQDEKNRSKLAGFCIVCLGKLGSKELNYASDIDLLYLYSGEGKTSGQGVRDQITNREYFVKLAERVTKIISDPSGEGAAYRVDLRLRPHGRVGMVAVSVNEAVNYYLHSAQAWERQTMIRSRGGAGETEIFKRFYAKIENAIYSKNETIENALQNVKKSKDKINLEHGATGRVYNVKLGKGGIREIEFIAQALQLARGGRDRWLRVPHTLISLSRLAERTLLTETETAHLFEAYEFLRRLEHRLQMENGLQTHQVPTDEEKLLLIARRMNFRTSADFNRQLQKHTRHVSRIFERVFEDFDENGLNDPNSNDSKKSFGYFPNKAEPPNSPAAKSIDSLTAKSFALYSDEAIDEKHFSAYKLIAETSPYFSDLIANRPTLIASLPLPDEEAATKDYSEILLTAARQNSDYQTRTIALRREWTRLFLEIAAHEIFGKIGIRESKNRQTRLAEAALDAGFFVAANEAARRHREFQIAPDELPRLAILGLGKLGSGGMDYGSDLDLALIFADDEAANLSDNETATAAVFYNRLAETLVNALSGFTREGFLYRLDLRLRPDGKNGSLALGETAFLNYLKDRSAIWEWLAYVKLRGVSGTTERAVQIEQSAREIIHQNAKKTDARELALETSRIRQQIAAQKIKNKKITDIKYGEGGLLDVYFAVRFLQLRDNVPDEAANRSTTETLKKLLENDSLTRTQFEALTNGYDFLSRLDHNLRLTVGRSNALPYANKNVLQIISRRMNAKSIEDLMENLALRRLEIHSAFEDILG